MLRSVALRSLDCWGSFQWATTAKSIDYLFFFKSCQNENCILWPIISMLNNKLKRPLFKEWSSMIVTILIAVLEALNVILSLRSASVHVTLWVRPRELNLVTNCDCTCPNTSFTHASTNSRFRLDFLNNISFTRVSRWTTQNHSPLGLAFSWREEYCFGLWVWRWPKKCNTIILTTILRFSILRRTKNPSVDIAPCYLLALFLRFLHVNY